MIPMLPFDPQLMTGVLNHFQRSALIASGLVAALFTARATLLLMTQAGPVGYGNLIREAVTFFLLIGLFPQCLRLANDIIGGLALKLSWEPLGLSSGQNLNMESFEGLGFIAKSFLSLGPWAVSHLAQSISTLLITVLVAIGPVVILLGTMTSLTNGALPYLSAILGLMLWPLLWNLLGSLSQTIWPSFQDTSLMKVIFWISIQLLQLLSPILSVLIFSNFAPGRAVMSTAAMAGRVSRVRAISSRVTSARSTSPRVAHASPRQGRRSK